MAASYPTSIKSFTTKNAGDTIQPAHINDLQDEVAALEGGLLNGTAPLNSSRSTLASLSVSGGSTLASLQVTGNSTIAGTLTVATIISTSITPGGVTSYVRAYTNVPQISASTAFNVVPLQTEVADLLGEFDSTTFTFTPQSAGYYLIHARLTIGPTSDGGGFRAGVFVNSTAEAQSDYNIGGGAGQAQTVQIALCRNLSSGANGAVTVRWCSAGSSLVTLSSGLKYTSLDITKIG